MYKYILENAGDINWMALFALLTFFSMFVISAVLVFSKNKRYIDKMANLPLENNHPLTSEIEHKS